MNIKNTLLYFSFGLGLLSFNSCKDDIVSELTTLETTRVFSPTGLDARIINQTGIRLNWKEVNNAESYTIEVFENQDFSGTPKKSLTGISFTQVPYTVTGLEGDMDYSVRVKAVGEGIEDSKWVTAVLRTGTEQIFLPVNPDELKPNAVTLNWPAGEAATSITVTPGNIVHTITTEELAAGEVTITGLTGETTYTAKLMDGAKVRGTITFTTLLDLGGATLVSTTEELVSSIAAAQGGEVFALMPGTYDVNADVTINKTISLKGVRPTEKPVVKGATFRIKANSGLSVKDVVLDATGSTNNNQAFLYEDALDNAYGALNIEDCVIKNYFKGLMYVNVKTLIESVNFKGNIISDIICDGGDFIDFRNGIAKTLTFSNNTLYNSALARDLFRMDAGGSTNFPTVTSVITVANNTFNAICNGAGNRIFYVRLARHEIYFTRNIVANSNGFFTNQGSTNIIGGNFVANNYFNAPNYTASTTANAKNDTGNFTTLNPGFAAPDAGDFTVTNEELKFNEAGDPRWR